MDTRVGSEQLGGPVWLPPRADDGALWERGVRTAVHGGSVAAYMMAYARSTADERRAARKKWAAWAARRVGGSGMWEEYERAVRAGRRAVRPENAEHWRERCAEAQRREAARQAEDGVIHVTGARRAPTGQWVAVGGDEMMARRVARAVRDEVQGEGGEGPAAASTGEKRDRGGGAIAGRGDATRGGGKWKRGREREAPLAAMREWLRRAAARATVLENILADDDDSGDDVGDETGSVVAAEDGGGDGGGDEEDWDAVAEEWAHEHWMEGSRRDGGGGGGPAAWEEELDDELWEGADEPFGDG